MAMAERAAARRAARAARRPALMTSPEAARELGTSNKLIQTAVREGTIPSVRIGKRQYIPASVVERMIRGEPALGVEEGGRS